jgi:uncharacterized membrane protein
MKTILVESERMVFGIQRLERTGAGLKIQRSATIDRPVAEIYGFWRNPENLPSFMKHLESVTVLDKQTSYWVLRSSENHLWAWGAEIIEDRRNEIISWRSVADANLQTAGSVRFSVSSDNQGTVVTLSQSCRPAADRFMNAMVKVFERDVQMSIGEDLSRLKTLLERQNGPIVMVPSHGIGKQIQRPIVLTE